MTAAPTASQRGSTNRRRGIQAERDVCRWLRANGFPHAERAVRTGFRAVDRTSADPGDITGTPFILWSIKDCAVEQIGRWFDELAAMDAGADLGLIVHKRRGHADPARWWCWLTLGHLVQLVIPTHLPAAVLAVADGSPAPLRMELGHVVPLLVAAGYGTPAGAA